MRSPLLALLLVLCCPAWSADFNCPAPLNSAHVECTFWSIGGTTTFTATVTANAIATKPSGAALGLTMRIDGVACNVTAENPQPQGSGPGITVVDSCTFDVPSDRLVRFEAQSIGFDSNPMFISLEASIDKFVPDNVLSVATTGSGSVSSGDGRIACGFDCWEAYAPTTTVMLIANPAYGWVFAGWGGACSGSARTCNVTMDEARTVTANFAFANVPPVVEFYNQTLDHYFITAEPLEATAIDNGSAGPGWVRTGLAFKPGGDTPVCRFYGSLTPGPNSHFYTAFPSECTWLQQVALTTPASQPRWNFETISFSTGIPLPNGSCAPGTMPVFRAFNDGPAHGKDSNHRFSTSGAAIDDVVARGWKNEGIVMCAPL